MKLLSIFALLVFAFVATVVVNAQSYNPDLAWISLWYSKVSSCTNAASVRSWNCGPPCQYLPDFQLYAVHTNATMNDLIFTGYDPVRKMIVVSAQGSEDLEEWLTDANFKQTQYPFAPEGCMVHEGFLQEWFSYGAAVLSDVAALRVLHPEATSILSTGHSLGAAVSLHAGLAIVREMQNSNFTQIPVRVYNFGEPRIGNPQFAQWATTTGLPGLHQQFRVVHKQDPVPHLPPLSFFGKSWLHVPREVWYDNNGNSSYKICAGTGEKEDPTCSDSVLPIVISDHTHYLGIETGCGGAGVASARSRMMAARLRKNPKWQKMVKVLIDEANQK